MDRRDRDSELATALNDGPKPREELPYDPTADTREKHGIARLHLKSQSSGNCAFGRQSSVYFIAGETDLKDVVRKYLEVNDRLLDTCFQQTLTMFFGRYSQEMKEAFREVTDEYDIEMKRNSGGYQKDEPDECPKCGEQTYWLPNHLRYHCRSDKS